VVVPPRLDDQDDDTRLPRAGAKCELLEIVTIVRKGTPDLAIHPMKMRPKYHELLPGG
jgi:hypothetical protein